MIFYIFDDFFKYNDIFCHEASFIRYIIGKKKVAIEERYSSISSKIIKINDDR